MKSILSAAILALVVAAPATADHKKYGHSNSHGHYQETQRQAGTIVVSCFRGPWNDVIWDRPNAVFIDSLVAIGYTFTTAHAIGERVCRDKALVNNPGSLTTTMRRIYNDANSRRNLN